MCLSHENLSTLKKEIIDIVLAGQVSINNWEVPLLISSICSEWNEIYYNIILFYLI